MKILKNIKILFFLWELVEEKFLMKHFKKWDLDYEEKKSLTSNDSFILNIKKIKKKIS